MEDLIERINNLECDINDLEHKIAALAENNENHVSIIKDLQKRVEDLETELNSDNYMPMP